MCYLAFPGENVVAKTQTGRSHSCEVWVARGGFVQHDTKIVFVNKGNSWYLRYVIHQAMHASPNSEVVLIGDSRSYHDITFKAFKSLQCEDLQCEDIVKFRKSYLHMSTNSEQFELFCWERWFYLRNYMRQHKVGSVLYLDSDVLLYSSIDEIKRAYSDVTWECGLSIPKDGPASGHVSYWTIDRLEDFCRFTVKSFRDQAYLKLYKEKWGWHLAVKAPGGVCDMTTLYLFYKDNTDRITNMAKSHGSNVFDNNINSASNYKPNQYITQNGIKKTEFIRNRPFFFKADLAGEFDQVHALHFQGGAKLHIRSFYSGKPFPGRTSDDLSFLFQCVLKKARNLLADLRGRAETSKVAGTGRDDLND